MTSRKMRRFMLIGGIIIISLTGLVLFLQFQTTDTQIVAARAPELQSPANGTPIVESDITLRWSWPQPLAANQIFALQLWYENEPPVEIWTKETVATAQPLIDGFSRDFGTFYWRVAVVEFSDRNGFEKLASEWSPTYSLNRVRRISPTPFPPEQQSGLAQHVAMQNFTSTTELIDYVRHFIAVNSADDKQDEFEPSYRDALDLIYASSQGQKPKPSLLCDGRSTAFLSLLEELGIESRLIFLYGDGGSGIAQHTVLEVFNPDTQAWEIHDALYDVYFVDADGKTRASVERLTFGDYNTISACNAAGDCSTELAARFAVYYQAFRYGYSDLFWVNPDRFNVSKRFPDHNNATLAELLTGNSRDFSFKFDNWEK